MSVNPNGMRFIARAHNEKGFLGFWDIQVYKPGMRKEIEDYVFTFRFDNEWAIVENLKFYKRLYQGLAEDARKMRTFVAWRDLRKKVREYERIQKEQRQKAQIATGFELSM